MRRFSKPLLLPVAMFSLAAGGCMHQPMPRAMVSVEPEPARAAWRSVAQARDAAQIDGLPERFAHAVAAVPARFRTALAREGTLLDPAAAQALPQLSPGPYLCRLVRIGGRVPIESWKPDYCFVDGDEKHLSLTKQGGSNLPGGWLFDDTGNRLIFLGTMRAASAQVAPAYASGKAPDVAAVIERVGPFRWRMVLAEPGKGAALDVYELVPAPAARLVLAPAAAPRK